MGGFQFRLWQIVLIGTFFGAVGIGGFAFVTFRAFELVQIEQRGIDTERSKLTPAADLVGVWRGRAVLRSPDPGKPNESCTETIEMTLTIQTQNGSTVAGSTQYLGVASSDARCSGLTGVVFGPFPLNPNETINGSRITITPGGIGKFSGTFTSDLITFNRFEAGAGTVGTLDGAATLTRQK
jgi:hypothetical protein